MICPSGTYCPVGSTQPTPCGNGTYNSLNGMSQCSPCPAGYFCTIGVGDYTAGGKYDCPPGYYCPTSTLYATQYPCPAGTYNRLSRRQAASDCLPAGPGTYASGTAVTIPCQHILSPHPVYILYSSTLSTPSINSPYAAPLSCFSSRHQARATRPLATAAKGTTARVSPVPPPRPQSVRGSSAGRGVGACPDRSAPKPLPIPSPAEVGTIARAAVASSPDCVKRVTTASRTPPPPPPSRSRITGV